MRSGKSLVVVLIVAFVLILAAGAGTGFFMIKRAQASAQRPENPRPEGEPRPAMIHSLGDMVVNLADTSAMRYAKISVALGFEKKVSDEALKRHQPVLRDAVIGVVTSRSFNDLHGKDGISRLKKALLNATRDQVPEARVVAVYLESLAMQ